MDVRYANKRGSKKKYLIEDTIIIDKIYPMIDEVLPKRLNNLKQCIGRCINSR